jgi:hypothetical protein
MAGKAYKGSSSNMVGSEGFLTLTIKMRVRSEPEWGKSPYLGISDRPDCPADDRCIPEQMRGTEPPFQGGEEVREYKHVLT